MGSKGKCSIIKLEQVASLLNVSYLLSVTVKCDSLDRSVQNLKYVIKGCFHLGLEMTLKTITCFTYSGNSPHGFNTIVAISHYKAGHFVLAPKNTR